MLRRTTSHELTEWQAYEAVEPFPATRTELMLAQISQIIANANRDAKKHPDPFGLDDFLILREQPEPTPEEIAERNAAKLGALFGGGG